MKAKILKSIEEINERIRKGEAVVCDAEEFKNMLKDGKDITPKEIDVVTTATCGIMSGTEAKLSVPVSEKGAFKRAREVWLNGVPAFPGSCPNERLGIVDVTVYGTSRANSSYGGGHLFRDLVEGKEIKVKAKSDDGRIIENKVRIDDLKFAKMLTTRSSFKNYTAFLNVEEGEVESIFSVTKLRGPYKEISVSGCGEINPVENDPMLKTIGIGTRILVNGAIGYVTGEGTLSKKEKPNLSAIADMHKMKPEYMGGFITSSGPECITSIAIPIIVNEKTLRYLKISDEDIDLPIVDVHNRSHLMNSDYARVWQGTDREIKYDANKCHKCNVCYVEKYCPTNAFSKLTGIDEKRCFNCGACLNLCPKEDVFKGHMGNISVNGKKTPITLRQSNRARAKELSYELKKMIRDSKFFLTNPVAHLGR